MLRKKIKLPKKYWVKGKSKYLGIRQEQENFEYREFIKSAPAPELKINILRKIINLIKKICIRK